MPDETSMFDRAIAALASLDIAASLDYLNKPGFETHDFGDHSYGIAIREHIEIHFWLCTYKQVAENTSCYVRVNDIDALRADFSERIKVARRGAEGQVCTGDAWQGAASARTASGIRRFRPRLRCHATRRFWSSRRRR